MAKSKTRTTGRKERIAIKHFTERHIDVLAESDAFPIIKLISEEFVGQNIFTSSEYERKLAALDLPDARIKRQLRQWWPIKALALSKTENNPAAYRAQLERLLAELEIEPPDGVLSPAPGTPGQKGAQAAAINRLNRELTKTVNGRNVPPKTHELARQFFGPEYQDADDRGRRLFRKRCAQALLRGKKRAASQDTQ